jgi:putative phage-type endonuclease
MKVLNLEQQSQEWLEFRNKGIGGSDIASIARIKGAFKSYDDVLKDKAGFKSEAPSAFLQQLFQQGHEWEEVVRNSFNNDLGYNFKPLVAVHDEHENFFASFDGADEDKQTLLEVKYCSTDSKFSEYSKKIPKHYFAQVQWQLFISGYEKAIIAFVNANGSVSAHHITPDIKQIAVLTECAHDFSAQLEAFKATAQTPAVITGITSPDIETLISLKQTEKALKAKLDELSDEINKIATNILTEHKAVKIENDQVSIQIIEKQGGIDYSKIPELENINLNLYRKTGTKYLQTKLK